MAEIKKDCGRMMSDHHQPGTTVEMPHPRPGGPIPVQRALSGQMTLPVLGKPRPPGGPSCL